MHRNVRVTALICIQFYIITWCFDESLKNESYIALWDNPFFRFEDGGVSVILLLNINIELFPLNGIWAFYMNYHTLFVLFRSIKHQVLSCLSGPQGPQLQKVLERLTGQHTVPNVFIGKLCFLECSSSALIYLIYTLLEIMIINQFLTLWYNTYV